MKRFKDFIKENDEVRGVKSLGGDGGSQNQYGRWGQEPVHLGVHRIDDPNVLQRLNAHVGLVNTREYIDPCSALEHLQNALMRLGYHFEYNLGELPREQNVYPLSRFGGRQGFIDMDAEIKEDDGIEASVGEKLVLNVEFVQDPDSSRYNVFAQIVPASLFEDDEDFEEDEDDEYEAITPDPIKLNRAGVPSTTGDKHGINMGEEVNTRKAQPRGPAAGGKPPVWDVEVNQVQGKFLSAFQKKVVERGWKFRTTPTTKTTVIVHLHAQNAKEAQAKVDSLIDSIDEGYKINMDEEIAYYMAQNVVYEQTLATKAGLSPGELSKKIQKIRREDPEISQKAAAGKAVAILAPDKAKKIFGEQSMPFDKSATATFKKESDARIFSKAIGNTFAANVDMNRVQGQYKVEFDYDREDHLRRARQIADGLSGKVFRESVNEYFREAKSTEGLNINDSISFKHPKTNKTLSGKIKTIFSTKVIVSGEDGKDYVIPRFRHEVPVGKLIEDLDRTFEFPSADARDRMAKLLDMASHGKVTKTDRGGQFRVTGTLKTAQIDRLLGVAKQLKGKLAENARSIAEKAVTRVIKEADVFKKHQLKIARDTLKMNPVFRKVMGGPSREEAIQILMKHGSAADKAMAKRELGESFTDERLKQARQTVKDGVQFVQVHGNMSRSKAEQVVRGAAEVLKQFGTPDDKKLAQKVLDEGLITELKFEKGDKVTTKSRFSNKSIVGTITRIRKTGDMAGNLDIFVRWNDGTKTTESGSNLQLKEAQADSFTAVAIKNGKVVDQVAHLERREFKDAVDMLKKRYPSAKISIEDKNGKVVRVEAKDDNEKELERSRKDDKQASAFRETVTKPADLFTIAGHTIVKEKPNQWRVISPKNKDLGTFPSMAAATAKAKSS